MSDGTPSVTSFASGPASLPAPVLEGLLQDILEWRSSGQSVLELPFTGLDFTQVLEEAEQDLRTLLSIPSSHRVLFLQGGASAHFALVPMNLGGGHDHADYVETGHWSRRAIAEARPWLDVRLAAHGDGASLPSPAEWKVSPDSAYCHYTSNETADGMQFSSIPETGDVPLVADMSADLLTRPIPVDRFGLIYASAQKNLGAAGLTIVIAREDLLRGARAGTPAPFDYTRQARERSRVNTPPTFAVAVAARMLRWLIETGGLKAAEQRSLHKSSALYAAIDQSGFYASPVASKDRSTVSVRFDLPSAALEKLFLDEASARGILYLGGHASVGGLRASLYNGVPVSAVETLTAFMRDFQRRRG